MPRPPPTSRLAFYHMGTAINPFIPPASETDLSNYYTKSQTNSQISNALRNYYTKSQVDSLVSGASGGSFTLYSTRFGRSISVGSGSACIAVIMVEQSHSGRYHSRTVLCPDGYEMDLESILETGYSSTCEYNSPTLSFDGGNGYSIQVAVCVL